MPASRNLTRHSPLLDPEQRAALLGQRGAVVWLTGLSGAGKSTLAYHLEKRLVAHRRLAFVLDGDNIRHGLCADLGFSPADRAENIRRIGEVAALFAAAGVIAITSFISPYRADRQRARAACAGHSFFEVYLDVPLEVCERRDPKGLYRKARAGELSDLTGVDAPYEPPAAPELSLDTGARSVEQCVAAIFDRLVAEGLIG